MHHHSLLKLTAAGTLVMAALFCSSCNNATTAGENNAQIDSLSNANDTVQEKDTSGTVSEAEFLKFQQYMAGNDTTGLWPPQSPLPVKGAVLPFKRVVAYYGNLYSKRMGALGEFPKDTMLKMLLNECERWTAADSLLPAVPALHYIAVTAQKAAGKDGKHRLRMPHHQIDTILNWSREINALTFVDIQVGHSSVQEEVPTFEKYLAMPTVHLGIDPEFAMADSAKPGSVIGSFSAADINYTIQYLSDIVKKHNLPPKMLIVHRFTQNMVQNYKDIKLTPQVQVVINMDGWGPKVLKKSSWDRFIVPEPVQYAGFKIFYKNDTKKGRAQLFQPEDLVHYTPRPLYIQYQ